MQKHKNIKNMEKKLNQELWAQQNELNIFLKILRFFQAWFCLLLIFTLFCDIEHKGIICTVLIVCIFFSVFVSWKRKKELSNIIQLLKKELRFWKAQKLEYQKVMEEITKKAGKEVNLTWFSNKIVLTEKNIQEIESWIENFKKLGWVYLDLAFF